MSRLCLDSPEASHLTQFTSLSSKEGSQGSLYLISTTSGLTSTTLSLTHSIPDTESSSILLRHAQHYCASGSLHTWFPQPKLVSIILAQQVLFSLRANETCLELSFPHLKWYGSFLIIHWGMTSCWWISELPNGVKMEPILFWKCQKTSPYS